MNKKVFHYLEGFRRSFSSTYSITVTYDNYGRLIVRVPGWGDIDESEPERYIKERHPDAKIVWESEDIKSHVKTVEDSHVREISVQERSVFKRTRRPQGSEIVELDSKNREFMK